MNVSEQSKFCEISLSFRCVKCYGFHIWHVNIWVEIFYNVSLPWIQNLIDIPNASKKICLSFTRVLNNSYFNESLVSGLIFLVSFWSHGLHFVLCSGHLLINGGTVPCKISYISDFSILLQIKKFFAWR